jgi:cytochrome P450
MVHTIDPTPAPSQTQLTPPYRAIARDPEMYPDPEEFKPERWLDPQYPTYKGPLTAYPTLIKCVHVHRSSFRKKTIR